jgi:spoIIIJ-associated protein
MNEKEENTEMREEAAKVLREILERMKIEAEVSAFSDGEKIILDAHGCESGLVIGKKGATLDSLQYLVSKIIFKKPGQSGNIIVDAEGYRGRREDSLTEMAKKIAEKVIKSGKPIPIEPMTPQDRKIIHKTLSEYPGVKTLSEGEGNSRRVVIFPNRK